MHSQNPWPQSRVPGLHSIEHILPSQFGASEAGTHSDEWQQLAGTQPESEEHSASSGILAHPLTKTIAKTKNNRYSLILNNNSIIFK